MPAAGDIAGPAAERSAPGPRVVVTALGVTQILAWGSSFYLLAVLAKPIAEDTGWPLPLVVGGFSAGLLVSGLVSPRVGRSIDRLGGRPVLALSSLLLAAGQASLAAATSLPIYLLAWLLMGAGMGAGLYDAAFATLGRLYGAQARRAITVLTLWGGFASTVGWPLSAALVEGFGWRGACLVYAGIQIAVSLPIHLVLLPRAPPAPPRSDRPAAGAAAVDPWRRRALLLHGGVLVLGATITSVISVHLLTLLQARGLDLAEAVALGALIGPAQVAARTVEMGIGLRFHPLWTMTAAMGLIGAGLLLLAAAPLAGLALILYGAGNGIYSIARGTVPLALFGPEGYATLMGRLAMPPLLASALAPLAGALLIEALGPGTTLMALLLVALAALALVVALRVVSRRIAPQP